MRRKNVTVLLVGNANVGKTSMFNKMTKSDQHVGNWHGVTVSITQKTVATRIVDLQ